MLPRSKPTRVIDPPLEELANLRTPLNIAEEIVLEFFNRLLPSAWEIYIQPHLNGLRPDFVLLNPKVGVAVYEVKGWKHGSRELKIGRNNYGAPILLGRNNDKSNFYRVADNPIDKIHHYKQELSDIYCARVRGSSAYRVITAGVIFPFMDDEWLQTFFNPFRERYQMQDFPDFYPLIGRKALETNDIKRVFPAWGRTSSKYMNGDVAHDLRGWLVEPDHSKTQRTSLVLNEKQNELAISRTTTGYRRIKGPAGSGKSLVIAARAASLANEGKKVLVVSYNITLLHYLRDLAVRFPLPGQCNINNVTFINFHAWCKRVCLETGHLAEYKQLFSKYDEYYEADGIQQVMDEKLSDLVSRILENDVDHHATYYDAVLVDEGQDFRQNWWHTLRKIHMPGGEMMLVADTTQDIYGRTQHWSSGAWTDQPMEGAGFRGPWTRMELTYRLPVELAKLANDFARRYLPADTNVLPEETSLQMPFDFTKEPVCLRWVQTDKLSAISVIYDEIINLIASATPNIGISDIVFLMPDRQSGRDLVERLAEKRFNVLHAFSEDEIEQRKQKHAFFMGDARLKGSTIHSFKGWETRALLIYAGENDDNSALPLLYTAMTRLKRHEQGSYLIVVNAIPTLAGYGSTWPEYQHMLSSGEEIDFSF